MRSLGLATFGFKEVPDAGIGDAPIVKASSAMSGGAVPPIPLLR